MQKDLFKIINNYGVMPQLEYFQGEVFELNEAIIIYENEKSYCDAMADAGFVKMLKNHIKEEIADCLVMINQFPIYYYYLALEECLVELYMYKVNEYEHIDDIMEYLKEFQKDICKLNCSIAITEERDQDYIVERQYKEITEKVDNVIYKLISIQLYYGITNKEVKEVMKYKINRQLKRIKEEKKHD